MLPTGRSLWPGADWRDPAEANPPHTRPEMAPLWAKWENVSGDNHWHTVGLQFQFADSMRESRKPPIHTPAVGPLWTTTLPAFNHLNRFVITLWVSMRGVCVVCVCVHVCVLNPKLLRLEEYWRIIRRKGVKRCGRQKKKKIDIHYNYLDLSWEA